MMSSSSSPPSSSSSALVATAAPPHENPKILHRSSSSYLNEIPLGPPDPILGIAEKYRACSDPSKVNVCIGAFRDATGKPWVLPSVREAERRMMADPTVNKEYAPIEGDAEFVELAVKFAYGDGVDLTKLAAIQSLSGTGACKIAGLFYAKFLESGRPIYIPEPTWGNHIPIFTDCGLSVRRYRWYDFKTNTLDFDGMLEDIQAGPAESIVLFHACAHNPTGCDPTPEQWKMLSDLCHEKEHHVCFDSAYQGFASGDAERDATALRMFVAEGHLVSLAQSFAKNFGLYGERCGTLSFVCPDEDAKARVMSQLKLIVRPMYSNPPVHGSNIVKTVLTCPDLRAQYYKECASMAERIQRMRELLVERLKAQGSKHDWSHVMGQIGMFAFTGMSAEMCRELTEKHFIFLTTNGRISLAGLTEDNIDHVAKAMHEVTDGKAICTEQ